MADNPDFIPSEEDKAHFLEHGFIKITKCFTREQAAEFTKSMWTRLGMSPTDKSTWTTEGINMPWHEHVPVSEFSPKAWSAMCQLLGGEDRISEQKEFRGWSDGLEGWHNDGDFFVHFLDSPEQALLVIPLWSDIQTKGGGTAICGNGIKYITKHLYEHPEGITPWMKSVNDPEHAEYEGREFWIDLAWNQEKLEDESFIEATGQISDVYLLHPLMLHSASKNLLRIPRVITNPPVSLKEPFKLYREDGKYSLVEQKTLHDLGMRDGLPEWNILGPRRDWTPRRIKKMDEMKRQESERLRKQQAIS